MAARGNKHIELTFHSSKKSTTTFGREEYDFFVTFFVYINSVPDFVVNYLEAV